MASRAESLDPVVVEIENEEPKMTFEEWLAVLAEREPVNLGVTATGLVAEAREAGGSDLPDATPPPASSCC